MEQKVDKLLDPETGIYVKLLHIESRLRGWAIAILTALLADMALLLLQLLRK